MIVPEYWSEAKKRISDNGKQRTIMRFGWSDNSEHDAHDNAKQRVSEAIDRLRAGESVRARDHKVPYNGAEGLPIREEIVERHGEAVITRNSYGALCLNTPDIVFADVDVKKPASLGIAWFFFIVFLIVGAWLSWYVGSWWVLAVGAVIGIVLSKPLADSVLRIVSSVKRDPFVAAREKIEGFAAKNPDWLLRLYRTPNGYRILVMHRSFDPTEELAFDFMRKIGSDPLYMLMCRNQKCFRARISPKPWRVDMEHIKPSPGVWPIKQEKMNARRDWIRRYDDKARHFSSCRFEATLGKGRTDRMCEAIRSVHDRYCKADQNLDIA